MKLIKLSRDIDGLGRAGSLVVAETDTAPKAGVWVAVVSPERKVRFFRWRKGQAYDAVVRYVIA